MAQIFDDTFLYAGDAIKALDNGELEGYLVRWGSESETDMSSMKDYFVPTTYLGASKGLGVDVSFNHGIPLKEGLEWASEKLIGRVVKTTTDDYGLLATAIIEADEEYRQLILDMVKQGRLRWSSGAVSHLVKRTPTKNNSNRIDQWVIGEAALTPIPAEPRLPAIVSLKSLRQENLEAVSEELVATNSADATEKPDALGNKSLESLEVSLEKKNMENEVVTSADVQALREELAEMKKVWNEAPQNKAGVAVANIKKVSELGDDNNGMKAFNYFLRKGQVPSELKTVYALQEGTAEEGGVLVPTDFYNRIVEKRDELSIARQAGATVIQTSLSAVDVPYEANAQAEPVKTAEEAGYDDNTVQPFSKKTVTVYKYTRMMKVAEELLADSAANLEQYIANAFARKFAVLENSIFLMGDGSGDPLGAIYGSTKGKDAASATALTAAEIKGLYYSLAQPYRDGAVWVMKGSTEGALRGLTGNPFAFDNTPSAGAAAGFDWLVSPKARVFNSDAVDAIAASKKPVMIGNWEFYTIVERAGLVISRNPYLYQANGQVGFFASVRLGGSVIQADAFQHILTPSA